MKNNEEKSQGYLAWNERLTVKVLSVVKGLFNGCVRLTVRDSRFEHIERLENDQFENLYLESQRHQNHFAKEESTIKANSNSFVKGQPLN
jgi:hypothetical protein